MLVIMVVACVLLVCIAGRVRGQKAPDEKGGANSKCYLCHAGMKTEEITTNHLAMGVTCDKCHGESTEHMHDEMLMTEPDLLFGRAEIAAMCGKCHGDHKKPEKVEAFRKEWTGKMQPNGRIISAKSVCTDCHGTHNIANEIGAEIEAGQAEQWIAAFNGTDLSGWKASPQNAWTVKGGRIYATLQESESLGRLVSDADYDDYLLVVTFKTSRKIQAGIDLRHGDSKPGPAIEISDNDKLRAFPGSVSVPERGLALVNLRDDLLDYDGWNTISAKVAGDRVQLWLNAEEIGAVRTASATKGKIGFYIRGNSVSKDDQFCIREVQIRKLDESGENEK